jgi:hypothetical protein
MKPMPVKHMYLSDIFKESNLESRDFSIQAIDMMMYHFVSVSCFGLLKRANDYLKKEKKRVARGFSIAGHWHRGHYTFGIGIPASGISVYSSVPSM